MIYGIGCDISKTERFEKWCKEENLLKRFFSQKEMYSDKCQDLQKLCEYYASRFAAKEAFVKALGTGFSTFNLSEIYVEKNEEGKPELKLEGKALEFFENRAGKNARIHLSLSHEKEYAMAYVVIEC